MEKKLNRSLQSPKGIVETKKSQDVPVGKPYSKSSRKRDTSTPKLDPSRKQSNGPAQKNKYRNKRSAAGGYHHESGAKNTELVSELDEDFDLKKSKKRDLTHLLNFHCKPREGVQYAPHYSGSSKTVIHNTIRDLMTTQKHKYNKEQFLQANCQFVVRSDEDYSVYMGDPDILVDWKFIEQIRVLAPEPTICPICLYYPVAAKITRCGHIFCWPCVLHYLALTDKPWHKCPICFEAVHRKDLKSVELLDQIQYSIGNEITFQLVKREHGSTITVPVSEGTSRTSNTLLYVSENQHTTVYSKLLLANFENVLKIIEDEEIQLKNELKENANTPELCFVEEAMQLLNERRAKLLHDDVGPLEGIPCCSRSLEDRHDIPSNLSSSLESNTEVFPFEPIANILDDEETAQESIRSHPRSKIRYESVSSNGEDITPNVTAEDLEITTSPNIPHTKDYYFYQAIDGQQIFLHSINARMLEREYGCLKNGPISITGTIVEIESGSMAEELRKRLRYLQHLPLTSNFLVIEVDLPPEIVSQDTKNYFKDQLDKRNRQREKRAKEERKIQKKAEQIANKQLGRHSSPKGLRLDSYHHFPECGSDTPPNVSPRNQSAASSRASSPQSNMSRRSTSPLNKAYSSLTLNNNTFAQKLKDTNKDGGWKKRATVSESEATTSHSPNMISDAVEVALILKAQQRSEADNRNSNKNKKKKKQKPVPLCSIGMVYTSQ